MAQEESRRILAAPPSDARLGPVHHVRNRVTPDLPDTLYAWEERATQLRSHILSCAGLDPLPDRCPLEAEVLGERQGDGFTVAAYRFQSLPGFWVAGNLFIPDGKGPFPAVLNPHGHWQSGRLEHSERGSVPARGVAFARMGAVALTIDMVGYNDSDQVEHRFGGPAEHLWGFGPLGLQLWNLIRAVDFLEQLDAVDGDRIGCTGASGGGTQTFLLTAVEPRIRVAAPVNMISAHMHGGCACENTPMLRIEANNIEIGALTAPRPLLMASATGDWTVETPELEFPAVRQVYDLYGHRERVECVQVDAPHNYNAETRAHVYRFFARWLIGRPEVDVETLEVPLPCAVEELRLYPTHARPKHVLTQSELFEQVKATHRQRASTLTNGDVLARVRKQLEGLLHFQAPGDDAFHVQIVDEQAVGSRIVRRMTLGTKARGEAIPVLLDWENGLPMQARNFGRDRREWPQADESPRLLVDSMATSPLGDEHVLSGATHPILCRVEPFMTGSFVTPVAQTGRNTGVTHFEGYNLTDAAWRALDIALTSSWLKLAVGRSSHLEARDDAGPWGLVSMALSPHIESAELEVTGLENDEASFIEKLYIPHLLRLGGLDALVTLCAPRPLTFTGASEDVVHHVRALYEQVGADHSFNDSSGVGSEAS